MRHRIVIRKAYAVTSGGGLEPFWMSYCHHPNGRITRMVPVDFRGHFFSCGATA